MEEEEGSGRRHWCRRSGGRKRKKRGKWGINVKEENGENKEEERRVKDKIKKNREEGKEEKHLPHGMNY